MVTANSLPQIPLDQSIHCGIMSVDSLTPKLGHRGSHLNWAVWFCNQTGIYISGWIKANVGPTIVALFTVYINSSIRTLNAGAQKCPCYSQIHLYWWQFPIVPNDFVSSCKTYMQNYVPQGNSCVNFRFRSAIVGSNLTLTWTSLNPRSRILSFQFTTLTIFSTTTSCSP